jgi:hypothetical protein
VTSADRSTTAAIRTAIAVSVLMIAYQVASRATRDALFLTRYDVTELPRMVATASALGLVAVITFSRLMGKFGPGRLVPRLFAVSAVLQLAEWGLLPLAPRPVTVLIYLHLSSLGALLVSGFWSLFNERLDPRTAKKNIGLIGAAGTAGGVAGGLMAERVGALLSISSMLPLLAVLHMACAALVLRLRAAPAQHTRGAAAAAPSEAAGLRTLAASPYLQTLAAAVLLTTVGQGLYDYLLNATAKATFGGGETLLRFFALFYAAINLLGMIAQAAVGRRLLEKLGVARTVGILPWTTAVGGLGALAFPGLPSILAVKTAEAVLRNSVYRSGYELLFTPLPAAEKRPAKALLDVGVVRIGDMLAAGLVQLMLFIWLAHAQTLMLSLAVVTSLLGIMITFRIHRGYVATLERNLLSRAVHLAPGEVRDRTTRLTMAAMTAIPSGPMLVMDQDAGWDTDTEATAETPVDPVAARFAGLRAAEADRILLALRAGPLDAELVPQAIRLLARDDVTGATQDALGAVAESHVGQFVDALLDPASDDAVRRRLPSVIARARSRRALEGLLAGLEDQRFEVRFRCGRALAQLHTDAPELTFAPERIHSAVLREIAVERSVWEGQRIIEQDDSHTDFDVDGVVRERASRSLSHVFTVLSLVLPREPLQIAFRGLLADDQQLRGTALEYLETALPPLIREKLWPFLGDAPTRTRSPRNSEDVVADLMRQRQSIALSVEAVRRLRDSQ